MVRLSGCCLMELTRRRLRSGRATTHYDRCAHCRGRGLRLNRETLAARILRKARLAANSQGVVSVEVRVHPEVALFLLNDTRARITNIETSSGRGIRIVPGRQEFEEFEILPIGAKGKTVKI